MLRPKLFVLAPFALALASCRASAPALPPMDPLTVDPLSAATAGRAEPAANLRHVDAGAPAPQREREGRSEWRIGQTLGQGYLGVNQISDFQRKGGSIGNVTGDGGSIDQYPVIGGGFQHKMGGGVVDMGLEALLSLGGRANGGAFVVGGGGAAAAVSLDLLVVDVYGGPFISVPLGEKARVYGAAGPLVQFASYHQSPTAISEGESGTGFGIGGYARAGVEFEMSSQSLIGLGVRWYDSKIDLSSRLGDLDVEGVEAMLTFSVLY